MSRYCFEDLKDFVKLVFMAMGAAEQNAASGADVLVSADLRGIESHGLARLAGYVRLWEAGRIDFKGQLTVLHETPSTATVDAGKGSGLIIAPQAMQIAIEKARIVGTGWVSVCNSSHFGIAGYHAMLALPHDMVGIAFTNASALVAPTFSKEKLLGTNPMAVAIPAGLQPPFVADFATTTASNGKLEILQKKGLNTPSGWVQDAEGNPVTDAHALKKDGAMLPLGSDREHGSHKGYMLGSIVDIFSAVLSGANFGPWVPPFPAYVPMPEGMPGKGIGHFFGAMRIDAFRPAADFKADMDKWLERFRSAQAVEGKAVIIPGDPEREMEQHHMQNGLNIDNQLLESLTTIAEKFNIEFPGLKK